jgi:hypothetical protein
MLISVVVEQVDIDGRTAVMKVTLKDISEHPCLPFARGGQ